MKITNNKLISENLSEIVISENTNNKGGIIDPKFIIIHYTAGRSVESTVEWFKNPKSDASAHLVIGCDGKLTQLIDFNKKAWHAGKSKWANLNGLNDFSIGIELDNPGRLSKVGDKYFSWFKKEYSKDNVVEAPHKHETNNSFWFEYTEEQIEICFKVCKLILENYSIQDILGHDDIAPFRKNDPGPLFPMENFRRKLLGREDDATKVFEIIENKVNIRKGSGAKFDSNGQLSLGTKVELMKCNNDWFFVYVLNRPKEGENVLYGWIKRNDLRKL